MGAPRDRALQAFEERGVGLDPVEQPGQRFGVTDRKVARVIASKQADRTVDARGQYRNAGGDGFRHDVRSPFAERRQNHGPRTG